MNINDRLLLCKESEGERADLKHEGEARGRFWVQFPPCLSVCGCPPIQPVNGWCVSCDGRLTRPGSTPAPHLEQTEAA